MTTPLEEKQQQQSKINQNSEWIEFFRQIAEGSNIKVDDPHYRQLEKVYWLGLIQGIRSVGQDPMELITQDIQTLIFIGKSPSLDYKVKQVRIRGPRTKKEIVDPGHDQGRSHDEPAAAA